MKDLSFLTPEVAKTAKSLGVDTYTGAVRFQHESRRFSILTRKGVKHARKLAAEHKRVVIHSF